jgi:hypothetical protein
MHYAKLTLAGGLMVALYSPAMAQVNPRASSALSDSAGIPD